MHKPTITQNPPAHGPPVERYVTIAGVRHRWLPIPKADADRLIKDVLRRHAVALKNLANR